MLIQVERCSRGGQAFNIEAVSRKVEMYISTLFLFSLSFNISFYYFLQLKREGSPLLLILKASGLLPVLLFSGSSSLSFI